MSTSYYLVNKKDRELKEKLEIFIEQELERFKTSLIKFNNDNEMFREDEICEKIKSISNELSWGILDVDEIEICNSSRNVTWYRTENWKNEQSFIKYYNNDNIKETYEIQDECGRLFTLEEFLEKVNR